jgi:hypothetical protein
LAYPYALLIFFREQVRGKDEKLSILRWKNLQPRGKGNFLLWFSLVYQHIDNINIFQRKLLLVDKTKFICTVTFRDFLFRVGEDNVQYNVINNLSK